jgi:hypothetical protein
MVYIILGCFSMKLDTSVDVHEKITCISLKSPKKVAYSVEPILSNICIMANTGKRDE